LPVFSWTAETPQFADMTIPDPEWAECIGKGIGVELRIGARTGDCPHIDEKIHAGFAKQGHEFFDSSARMADRVKRMMLLHRLICLYI